MRCYLCCCGDNRYLLREQRSCGLQQARVGGTASFRQFCTAQHPAQSLGRTVTTACPSRSHAHSGAARTPASVRRGMVFFYRSLRAQPSIPCYNTSVWAVQRAQYHNPTPHWTPDMISDVSYRSLERHTDHRVTRDAREDVPATRSAPPAGTWYPSHPQRAWQERFSQLLPAPSRLWDSLRLPW